MTDSSTLQEFWSRLAVAQQSALLLDYDGTLAPFRVERDKAFPYPGVYEVLTAIQAETTTRLVIISGRAIADLLPLLGMQPAPEIWGCHGWEHLPPGQARPDIDLPQRAVAALQSASEWLKSQRLEPYCERKPASLAIHWRGLSKAKIVRLREQVTAGWLPLVGRSSLELHPFNGGLELRCPGKDKGTAIKSILNGLAANVPVAFLGDDLTDEDGFAAINGRGLGVLVSGANRVTQAQATIAPPEGLLGFLETWLKTAPRS